MLPQNSCADNISLHYIVKSWADHHYLSHGKLPTLIKAVPGSAGALPYRQHASAGYPAALAALGGASTSGGGGGGGGGGGSAALTLFRAGLGRALPLPGRLGSPIAPQASGSRGHHQDVMPAGGMAYDDDDDDDPNDGDAQPEVLVTTLRHEPDKVAEQNELLQVALNPPDLPCLCPRLQAACWNPAVPRKFGCSAG